MGIKRDSELFFLKFLVGRLKILIPIFFGWFNYPNICAQIPKVDWIVGHNQIQYGKEDFPKCGLVTRNGEYISAGIEEDHLIVIKLDSTGKTKWVSRIGDRKDQYGATSIEETSKGHLLIGGFHGKNMLQERVLLSLNAKSGDIRWIKFYKNEGFGAIEGVKEAEDGNIIMTGYVNGTSKNGFLSMESDGIIMKTDSLGNLLWVKKLVDEDNGIKIPSGMRILKDDINGGYVISSTVYRDFDSNRDFCLVKTDTA